MIQIKREFFKTASDRMPVGMRPSAFTDRSDWLGQGDLTFAVTNGFPVSLGHTLVLPRDFGVYRFTELARDEVIEHFRMLKFLTRAFNQHFKPDGYNVGWNIEFAGGQSIAHAHMHIIPRYLSVNAAFDINAKGGVARLPFPQLPALYQGRQKTFGSSAEKLLDQMPDIARSDLAYAVNLPRDAAVTPGHSFVFPRQDRASLLECTEEEFAAQLDLALEVMAMQQVGSHAPDGYNLGWDIGRAAGQALKRAYLQVIPRYKGDMESPRGGIIHVTPKEAWPKSTEYYDKKNVGKDVALEQQVIFPFHFWDTPRRQNTIDLKKELGIA